jgi:sugar-phosphatase
VIVDSSASVERAWRRWAAANGVDYEDLAPRLHGVPSRQTIAAVAPRLDAARESRRIDAAQADDVRGVVALPGARTLLSDGYGSPVAIVTSCGDRLARARLRAAAIEPPAVMVTSDQVERGKPHPEAYLLGAERIARAPADCVVIEDAPAGVAAGKAAGMRVVAVLTTHGEAELSQADDVVANLTALSELFDR